MLDKLIFSLRKPKYCKNCGGKLVTDELYYFSDQTGEAIYKRVGIRCENNYTCFEKYGYLYRWGERVQNPKHEADNEDPHFHVME